MFNEILSRQPVNKTTAIVASEGHRDKPTEKELLTQDRENIVRSINSIKSLLGETEKGNPKRKKLKARLSELEQEIRDVNKRIGITSAKSRADIGSFIIDEAKKMLTKHQWEKIMINANRRYIEDVNQ